jgi:hypothetical protein
MTEYTDDDFTMPCPGPTRCDECDRIIRDGELIITVYQGKKYTVYVGEHCVGDPVRCMTCQGANVTRLPTPLFVEGE